MTLSITPGTIVVNFAHPLTDGQHVALAAAYGPIDRVIEVRTEFDQTQPFAVQARQLVDQVALPAREWQTSTIVVNPPSLSAIACAVLAELHGRIGHFPPIVRLRPATGVAGHYEFAETINLQQVRDSARTRRGADAEGEGRSSKRG